MYYLEEGELYIPNLQTLFKFVIYLSPVSSINKGDHHDITEILLKVALNTINQPNQPIDMILFLLQKNLDFNTYK
jgi:hypothetical protein